MEENEQNEAPQSASEQAEQSPEAPTSGAPAVPAAGTIEDNEVEAEQREHLERRSEPQLPDPETHAAEQLSPSQSETESQQTNAQPEQPNS